MKKRWSFFFCILLLAAGSARAACVDDRVWDGLLRETVDARGFVDYDAVRKRSGDLDAYLSRLAKADLSGCSADETLAFWINAYNAEVFRAVLDRPRLQKISDDFALFDRPVSLAGRTLSLNDIEHRVLRSDPKKGGPLPGLSLKSFDPRVHFALVCGAIDCPRLLNAAWDPARLEEQLHNAELDFANSTRHLRMDQERLVISSLMDWYAGDFNKLGGVGPYLARLTHVRRRADERAVDRALGAFPKGAAFGYDWTLNSVKNRPN